MLKSFPSHAVLYEGGRRLTPRELIERDDGSEWRAYSLKSGYQVLTLRADGYRPKWLHLRGHGTVEIGEKLERVDPLLRRRGELGTGARPKGVAFAPDGRTLVVTNLSGTGIDLYRVEPFEHIGHIELPAGGGSAEGFVEGYFLPGRRELWVSQMSTDQLHLLSSVDYRYITSVPSGGRWPKVMVADREERRLYVSNWAGRSIGVIALEKRKLLGSISVPGVPRGMAVTPDGETLYVGLYEGGDLIAVDLTAVDFSADGVISSGVSSGGASSSGVSSSGASSSVVSSSGATAEGETPLRRIEIGSGALRHLELSRDGRRLYISDMYTGEIILFDTETERVVRRRRVGSNPNTIGLTPDGSLLLVSERGRNHPQDYRFEGPAFGRVFLCDAITLEPVGWIWGRNQPTGLDISPDGRFLGFTDFMDDNLELYELTPSSFRAATN